MIRRITMLLALSAPALSGCMDDHVPTDYGRHDTRSVNGTDVFASMFTAAGHKVRFARRRLNERIRQRADCIVWVPDSYHLPTTAEQEWLYDDWLTQKSGRTLMYVARDYDAGPEYWKKMLQGAPADKAAEMRRRLSETQTDADARRAKMPTQIDCDWFRFVPAGAPVTPGKIAPAKEAKKGDKAGPARLQGEPAWKANIDPAKLEIKVTSKLDPVFDADVMLELDGDVLVSRERVVTEDGGSSQLIVVANGSFLLNLGLVNREHRKLAARLVTEISDARLAPPFPTTPDAKTTATAAATQVKQVYFVESDDSGLELLTDENPAEIPEDQKWPPERLRTTFLHLAALAIILIISRWPIFGRPREEKTQHESDFGRHVEALGDLLARSGNPGYAQGRLEHYQKTMQGDGTGKNAGRKA